MTNEEHQLLADFKAALMREAYESFLEWASKKPEVLAEYEAFIVEANAQDAYEDAQMTFVGWVTEYYWGEIE